MFYVGQKVVCIWTPIPDPTCPFPIFEKGAIYTVASLDDDVDGTYISVVELHHRVTGHVSGFRPLTDQKKSVSFTAGAPDDSERWDNRRKVVEHAKGEV